LWEGILVYIYQSMAVIVTDLELSTNPPNCPQIGYITQVLNKCTSMRYPNVAPISFCKATDRSQEFCKQINNMYKEGYTTEQIAEELDMSKTAVRYYYYGIHNCSEAHFHWKNAFDANKAVGYIQYSLNQIRVGTAVPI